jgi:DNA-binding transcriptional regulator YiaG
MRQQYKSEILGVIHEDAVASYEAGAIDPARLRMYDEACLAPEMPIAPVTPRVAPQARVLAFA